MNIILSVTYEGERRATVIQELRERLSIDCGEFSFQGHGEGFLRKGYTLESFLISLFPSSLPSFLFSFFSFNLRKVVGVED